MKRTDTTSPIYIHFMHLAQGTHDKHKLFQNKNIDIHVQAFIEFRQASRDRKLLLCINIVFLAWKPEISTGNLHGFPQLLLGGAEIVP